MVEKKEGPRERRGKSGKRSEKGRPLGGKREESRQKKKRQKREEITKGRQRSPKLIDSRVCWSLSRLESLHFYRVGGLEAS